MLRKWNSELYNFIIKALITGMAIFTWHFGAFAQLDADIQEMETFQMEMMVDLRKISFPTKAHSNHNLFLNKNWQFSSVKTSDSKLLSFNGRYNILNKGVELLYQDQIRTLNSSNVSVVRIGEQILLSLEVEEEKVTIRDYFELLSDGKVKLLCRYTIKSEVVDANSLVPQVTGETKFKIEEEFYTLSGDHLKPLRTNKNKVLDLMEVHENQMESFLNENKIRFGRREDLILIFDYFNDITE